MIKNAQYNGTKARTEEVKDFLRKAKEEYDTFTVIDIGASIDPWARGLLDATVDIMALPYDQADRIHFQGNINYFDVWSDLLKYVDANGKFDFAICSHTLEDISNPGLVAKMLPRIAKAGFNSTPSKFVECGRWGRPFTGWHHHRWIFNYEDGKIVGYPKLPCTEYLDYFSEIAKHHSQSIEELSYYWSDSLELEIVQDDFFLAENQHEVYQNLIPKDGEDPFYCG